MDQWWCPPRDCRRRRSIETRRHPIPARRIPRCFLYQPCNATGSLAWKKTPPIPVTRFIRVPRWRCGDRLSDIHGVLGPPPRAIHSSTTFSSTASGIEPLSIAAAWKSLTSNSRPSAFSARARSSRHLVVTEQVAERLRRVREVAVDLAHGEALSTPPSVAHVGDRLVARPVVGVNAGVDDEARGAEELRLKVAVALVRILVEPQVVAEPSA